MSLIPATNLRVTESQHILCPVIEGLQPSEVHYKQKLLIIQHSTYKKSRFTHIPQNIQDRN